MKKYFALLFFAFISWQPFIGTAAELKTQQDSDLAQEVIQMTQSLDGLIGILKTQQVKTEEFQKLQAAISYLSFRYRSIETKQMGLRFKEEQRDSIVASMEKIESDPEGWEKRIATYRGEKSLSSPGQAKQAEMQVKRMQERLKDLNADILEMETEILTDKNELASFESFVQSKIGLIE